MRLHPHEIISEALREGDVRPTLQLLSGDLAVCDEALSHLDKEIAVLQGQLGPVLLAENPPSPPTEGARTKDVPQPARCGLSADIQDQREKVLLITGRIQTLAKWVETIRGDLRL